MCFALPKGSKYGDLVHVNYKWTASDKQAWDSQNLIPCKLMELPESTQLLTNAYIIPTVSPDLDLDNMDAARFRVTPAIFKRIEETPDVTFVMILVGREVEGGQYIPGNGIEFTSEQRKGFADGTINDQNPPILGECLTPAFKVLWELGIHIAGMASGCSVAAGELLRSMGESV